MGKKSRRQRGGPSTQQPKPRQPAAASRGGSTNFNHGFRPNISMMGMSGGAAGRMGGGSDPAPSAWADGLSPSDRYEWFSNCYQMRCDDDYAWGGGYLHGPYDPDATAESLGDDFLAFCVLARRAGVVPSSWSWSDFLRAAPRYIVFAFEKSDAKRRLRGCGLGHWRGE